MDPNGDARLDLAPLARANFDVASVEVVPVQPVDDLYGRFGGRCLALYNVLSLEECRHLVDTFTQGGQMEEVKYRIDYRRNDRCIVESQELAGLLWRRIEHVVRELAVAADTQDPSRQSLLSAAEVPESCPEELRLGFGGEGVWRPVGLNECLRFCRYAPGGFFRAHCDTVFRRSEEEMSLFTCMFYLDGGLTGGETRFMKLDMPLSTENGHSLRAASDDQVLAAVAPEPGLCLLFFQPGLVHEGGDLLEGTKHILRTDVMFRRDPGSGPRRSPQEEEAWALAREAEKAEMAGDCDRACQLYRRAFKLDPKLERAF